MVNKSLLNVILVGLGFMLVFTAFQTMGNIQKTILASVQLDDPDFDGKAYYSLAIIYVSFSLFNWTAPSIISVIGPRLSMVIGAGAYTLYMLQFVVPQGWLLYLCSAILGIGAAFIWTGQGNYLTLNSTKENISRYSGIFWCLLQLSLFIGNTFVYFTFRGLEEINKTVRIFVILTLSSVGVGGLLILLFLPKATRDDETEATDKPESPWSAFVGAVKLFCTFNMLLLSITFIYTGLELGFWSGVYSSCIGFTKALPNRKELVGMSGIFMGLGEIIGGGLFGILGNKTVRYGREPIIAAGFVIHVASFIIIYLNLPDESPFYDTFGCAIICSSPFLAILCSFLLGLGDSFYNTQIYAMLGSVYADSSAPAFAIFKFTQCVGASASFIYAESLGLYWQLRILLITVLIGTVSIIIVELRVKKSSAE